MSQPSGQQGQWGEGDRPWAEWVGLWGSLGGSSYLPNCFLDWVARRRQFPQGGATGAFRPWWLLCKSVGRGVEEAELGVGGPASLGLE